MEDDIWKKRVIRNKKISALWTVLWTISMLIATFGPKFIWKQNTALTIAAVIVGTVFGVGMMLANIRQLKSLDELQKKIQMEAMGLALGVGVVGGLSYSLLDTTNLMDGDAEIAVVIVLISVTYFITIVIGQFRYK